MQHESGGQMDEPIIHEEHEGGGGFFIRRGGACIAEMTYRRVGPVAVFDHTEVDPALRGQGVAGRLFDAAVAWARANGIRVTPRCSYVVARFRRDPSLADVLA
jgi:predicted GNAT family acetyltransferase